MIRSKCDYDILIVGGGPSGSTAAIAAARAGLRVGLFEKSKFPRFQIGESFLPANYQLMERMGLDEKVRALPHMVKYGAEFRMGGGDGLVFRFNGSKPDERGKTRGIQVRVGGLNQTINLRRADFDRLLLDEAREAGAQVHQPASVESIEQLDADGARLIIDGRPVTGRFLFDASGHATLVGRHLGTRRFLEDPHLRKVAYFEHFDGVRYMDGDMAGSPTVVMCDEGWFWIIPLSPETASVGLVVEPDLAKRVGVAAKDMLRWGMERCPVIGERLGDARGPAHNLVRSDFSYTCAPYAGPGYFMLGDAATFFDPIFSSGVAVGMIGGVEAAERVKAVIDGKETADAATEAYRRFIDGGTRHFIRSIEHFYDHAFRELFLNGQGPFRVQEAVLAVLAGHVFPRPAFWIRWRYRLFEMFIKLNRRRRIVPERERFSLVDAPADQPVPAVAGSGLQS